MGYYCPIFPKYIYNYLQTKKHSLLILYLPPRKIINNLHNPLPLMPARTPLNLPNQNLNQRFHKNLANLLLLIQIAASSKMDNQIDEMGELVGILGEVAEHFYEVDEEFPDFV